MIEYEFAVRTALTVTPKVVRASTALVAVAKVLARCKTTLNGIRATGLRLVSTGASALESVVQSKRSGISYFVTRSANSIERKEPKDVNTQDNN